LKETLDENCPFWRISSGLVINCFSSKLSESQRQFVKVTTDSNLPKLANVKERFLSGAFPK